jgi:SAM-dependent methyltransferase
MQPDNFFQEQLPRTAAENFELAERLCQSYCGQMHALWSYIRLARASPGAEPTSSKLEYILSTLIAAGCRKVLIAGSQDTGLLGLVARAGSNAFPEIVVLDRCATPLEACQRLARSWSLPIKTVHADLMNLDMCEDFELVLLHFTLHYIPADRQVEVLGRLRHALRPTGRLLLLVNVGQAISGALVSEHRDGYADWVLVPTFLRR